MVTMQHTALLVLSKLATPFVYVSTLHFHKPHIGGSPALPHQVFHILPAAFWRPQRCCEVLKLRRDEGISTETSVGGLTLSPSFGCRSILTHHFGPFPVLEFLPVMQFLGTTQAHDQYLGTIMRGQVHLQPRSASPFH